MNRNLVLAWHIAGLQRQKKLPSLSTLLRTTAAATPRQQNVGQLRNALHVLSAKYGGTLRGGARA